MPSFLPLDAPTRGWKSIRTDSEQTESAAYENVGTLILDVNCDRFYYYKARMYREKARNDYRNLEKCKSVQHYFERTGHYPECVLADNADQIAIERIFVRIFRYRFIKVQVA